MEAIRPDWHEHFFEGLWLEIQGLTFDEESTRELADAATELLQLLPGARILDVPCGEGRIALELARRGYSVTGLDRSRVLLDQARAKAQARNLEVEWLEADMWGAGLAADRRFDGAVCLWGSFGYGTEEQDGAFLRRLAEALPPGANLVLDTHVVETLLPQWEPRSWRQIGEVLVCEDRRWVPEAGRVETEWTLSSENRRELRHSSIRIYTYRELCNLLIDSGFEDCSPFGSPDLEAFELGSSRLLLAATRNDGSDD
jgi:SAM-dependent methyltransferase